MRLYEVDEKYSILRHRIMKECSSFLEVCKRDVFVPYRGTNKILPDGYGYFRTRTDRSPTDTPVAVHDSFVEAFDKAGFKANRHNSIFVSGSISEAYNYGKARRVLPVGKFSFTWSPEVYDLTREFRKLISYGVVKQVFADDVYYDADKITYGHHIPDAKDFVDGKLKMSDYYAKYGDDKFLPTKLPYTLDGDGLVGWVKENYQDHDWESAIISGNEIMIACEGYWMLENEILQSLELFE